MIAFELNQQSDQLWIQKQHLLKQLDNLSNQPITASPEPKESLLKDFRELIYSGKFDSLFGGYVTSEDSEDSGEGVFQKPITNNAYLCEILYAADQVFFTGEFSFIAAKIANLLTEALKNNGYQLMPGLPILETSIVGRELSQKEALLFSTLTNSNPRQFNSQQIISFRKTLKQASQELDMHFKEAQVIESNLVKKLQRMNREPQKTLKNEQNILIKNVETFIALVSYHVNSDRFAMSTVLDNYFDNLMNFSKENKLYFSELVFVTVSIIYYLQIEYSDKLIDLFNEFFREINSTGSDNIQSSKQLNHYLTLVNDFNHCLSNANESLCESGSFQFIFLNRDDYETVGRISELNSKFSINSFVFLRSNTHRA